MVTLQDFDSLPAGARFFSADLHVHSYGGSHDVKDAAMTPEALVDAAIKQRISVLALTDHNSIKNTERSITHAQQYLGRILVLAGVEITTAHGHLLVYFAPDAIDKLQGFLSRLDIVKPTTNESHTSKSMADTISEAARLGGICVAAHIDRKTGFESIVDGYPNWKKDIISSPGLVGLEFADAANLGWYSLEDQTPQATDRKKLCDNRNRALNRAAPLAQVQNSDAHSLSEFGASRSKRTLTRIKMNDLTFDGFRTAFADPAARVRATASLPPSVPRLLAMQVSGGFLRDERYRFSDNLNCFIGGRGTGKSTAVRCIAHALGLDDELERFDNCPDSVVLYCRDAAGVLYRYERMRGCAPEVKAKDDNTITDVPVDAFRVEFYGQNALAEVARDPLAHPKLFQEFLDRNTVLSDLFMRERELLSGLEQNGSQLRPLEAQAATRPAKKTELEEVGKKLRIAEEGKLKELVAAQMKVSAEKVLAKSYGEVRDFYSRGISLNNFIRDARRLEETSGARTGDSDIEAAFAAIKKTIESANAYIGTEQASITARLKGYALEVGAQLAALDGLQKTKDVALATQVANFQKAGLSASVADLQRLITRQGQLTGDINRIDQSAQALADLRKAREALLTDLKNVRAEITERRKALVREINKHLISVIDDYTVAIRLQTDGIIDEFVDFVTENMHGTYFQDEQARGFCQRISPEELADFVRSRDHAGLAAKVGLSSDWSTKICGQLGPLERLHCLETIWKTPRPEILVVPKTSVKPRPIPVNQLSDGQRHTIFLTIAMLADSDAPLVIDQPEDDLDNAFIFSSVVETLRHVKERRQVVVVTHNANIAVLGDAELIFPMRRVEDRGLAQDRGAIDRKETRDEVQRILEGGEEAFRRRKEIYGY
jgi:DNA repair ATPase RecN